MRNAKKSKVIQSPLKMDRDCHLRNRSNVSEFLDKELNDREGMDLAFSIAYPLIFAVGFFWNSVTIFIFNRQKKTKRDSFSVFLTTQSVADNGYLLITILSWVENLGIYTFNARGIYFLSKICSFMSVYCTVFIAFDNFIRICHPLKAKRICSVRNSRVAVCLSAAVAVILHSVVIFTLENTDDILLLSPRLTRHILKIGRIVNITDITLTSVLPVVIYCTVIVCVRKQNQLSRRLRTESRCETQTGQRSKLSLQGKVLAMLIGITSIHVFFRIPYPLLKLTDLHMYTPTNAAVWHHGGRILTVCKILFCLNFSTSWLVYVSFGKTYRKRVRHLFVKT